MLLGAQGPKKKLLICGVNSTKATTITTLMTLIIVIGPRGGPDQTLNLMERDYVYPEVGDRLSPKDWKDPVLEVRRVGDRVSVKLAGTPIFTDVSCPPISKNRFERHCARSRNRPRTLRSGSRGCCYGSGSGSGSG